MDALSKFLKKIPIKWLKVVDFPYFSLYNLLVRRRVSVYNNVHINIIGTPQVFSDLGLIVLVNDPTLGILWIFVIFILSMIFITNIEDVALVNISRIAACLLNS